MIEFLLKVLPSPAPQNLLPAGLPEALGNVPEGQTRTVIFQDKNASLRSKMLGGDAVHTDGVLPGLKKALSEQLEGAPIALGPMVNSAALVPGETMSINKGISSNPDEATDVGIIDAGIAFWNPAFRDGGKKGFSTIGALNYGDQGIMSGSLLEGCKLSDLLAKSETEILEELSEKFPNSVFGKKGGRSLYQRDGLAHGTAMADLVIAEANTAARIHGLELPATVLQDFTGGQMAAVMDIALRNMVQQAQKGAGAKFRLVVVMAFGFTGGPIDGEAEILQMLQTTVNALNCNGTPVELMIPIGNHRQDRLRAQLSNGQSLAWRILPDDHSANTVEIIQCAGQPPLSITAPDGKASALPGQPSLTVLQHNLRNVGAVWVRELDDKSRSTRITLSPTAPQWVGQEPAPFGAWRLTAPQTSGQNTTAVDLWILRDETGYEDDPTKPSRASWFEHPDYVWQDVSGLPIENDPPGAIILRKGTISILATSNSQHIHSVTATVGAHGLAPYASLPSELCADLEVDLADTSLDTPHNQLPRFAADGRAVLGNGGPNRFRAAGTSLAAAIAAAQSTHLPKV